MENKKHKTQTRNTKSLLPPLEAFLSKLSNSLNNLNEESEIMFSLEFVKQCFKLFPLINTEFAKLVLELDCPRNKWAISNTDEYLNYTLNILKLLNSVSSCLSKLSQDRVSLLHALQLAENSPSVAAKHLSNINSKKFGNRSEFEVPKINEERKKSSGKESKKGLCKQSVIHEALVVMKSISFWVFGVLLSGLCSHVKPYIEMRKLVGRFDEPLFRILDTKVEREILGKKGEVKEVKEVIIAAESLVGALGTRNTEIATSELRSRLEVVEKLLDGLQKETNDMFGEILAARNNLLDSLRLVST